MSCFCGATSTPVLDFWWHLWVSKPERVLPYSPLAVAYVLHVSWDSHLVLHLLTSWQTVWPPSWSLPHTCEDIGGTRMGDLSLHERTLNRLSYAIFFRFPAGDIIQLRELLNTCVKKENNPVEKVSDLSSPPLQSLESDNLQLYQSDIAKLRSTHSYQLLKSRYENHSQKIENYRFSSKGFLIHFDMTLQHPILSFLLDLIPCFYGQQYYQRCL